MLKASASHYEEVASILGKGYITGSIESPFDYIRVASRGLDAHIIRNFQAYFQLSRTDTAQWLHASEPTVYRWVRTSHTLDRNRSVQLFELTDLFVYGSGVFSGRDAFFQWMEMPNIALGGMMPKQLLAIPGGIEKVRTLLGRIEFGVFS